MDPKYILTISLKQIKVLTENPVESFMSECVEMSNEDFENVNGVKWYKVENELESKQSSKRKEIRRGEKLNVDIRQRSLNDSHQVSNINKSMKIVNGNKKTGYNLASLNIRKGLIDKDRELLRNLMRLLNLLQRKTYTS